MILNVTLTYLPPQLMKLYKSGSTSRYCGWNSLLTSIFMATDNWMFQSRYLQPNTLQITFYCITIADFLHMWQPWLALVMTISRSHIFHHYQKLKSYSIIWYSPIFQYSIKWNIVRILISLKLLSVLQVQFLNEFQILYFIMRESTTEYIEYTYYGTNCCWMQTIDKKMELQRES